MELLLFMVAALMACTVLLEQSLVMITVIINNEETDVNLNRNNSIE
jgi:hypothetical protein